MKISQPIPSPILSTARDLANISLEGFESVRTLFRAISNLPDDPSTARELAGIGLRLADDYHNLVDCEQESLEAKVKEAAQ